MVTTGVQHCMSIFRYELDKNFNTYSIKIHDMNELKEVYSIVNVEEEKGYS